MPIPKKISDIPFGKGNVGLREPVKIIAEIGINHEGDVGRCKSMIQMAAEANVDAIKLQTADPDEHYQRDPIAQYFLKSYVDQEGNSRDIPILSRPKYLANDNLR